MDRSSFSKQPIDKGKGTPDLRGLLGNYWDPSRNLETDVAMFWKLYYLLFCYVLSGLLLRPKWIYTDNFLNTIRVVAGKWVAPMGRISRVRDRPLDRPGQVSRSASCGSERYLEAGGGEVCHQGVGIGGKGGFWDRATMQGGVGGNRGGYSRDASLVGAARPGGWLVIAPHWWS